MSREEKVRLCVRLRLELEGIDDERAAQALYNEYNELSDVALSFELEWLDDVLGK